MQRIFILNENCSTKTYSISSPFASPFHRIPLERTLPPARFCQSKLSFSCRLLRKRLQDVSPQGMFLLTQEGRLRKHLVASPGKMQRRLKPKSENTYVQMRPEETQQALHTKRRRKPRSRQRFWKPLSTLLLK